MANISKIPGMKKLTCLLIAACVVLSFSCRSEAAFVPPNVQTLQGTGRICFVPLGAFPSSTLESLAAHYRGKYGISIEILRPVQLDSSVMNADRQQAVAESLIAQMRRGHPRTASDPQAIMIGFTEEDMYANQ